MDEQEKIFLYTLPQSIRHDILKLEEARRENSDFVTDWWCELYGSINGSYHGREIDKKTADYLFEKYLHMKRGDAEC